MSRCYPYPPPGYEKKAAQPVAEIIPAPQAPRKEKHKHKEKDKDKKKKRKRDDDAKDDNAHKEKRSSKNQKAAPVNDVVGAVHSAENGRIPEPNAAATVAAAGDRKPPVEVEREGNVSLQEGRSLQDARIFSSSERDAGKPGSRVSVSSTTGGKPSSSSSSEHQRAAGKGRDGAPDARASLSRTGLEAKTSRDAAKASTSSFDARGAPGKDPAAATAAAASRSGSGREEARTVASRNDARRSQEAKASSVSRDDDDRAHEARASRNDARSSAARDDAPVSVSRVEPAAKTSKSEASRKHEKSSKKRDHAEKPSSSKTVAGEKEINGKLSPRLIPAKPLDTGQPEQQQQQQQHQHQQQPVQQLENVQQQQQQQPHKASGEPERVSEPKLKRLKLAEIPAEPNYGDEYLGWLVSDKKKKPVPISGAGEDKALIHQQQQQQVWADALYLPAVDLYALPYVVPD